MGYADQILQQPPKGEWLSLKEKPGHLLAIFGNSGTVEMPDNMNPGKTRIVATIDYADLDDGQGGRIVWGAQVDKPGIVNKLKNQTGTILGRVAYGEAKAGQSPPYVLDDHTPEDAHRFLNVWMPANRAALSGKAPQKPAPQAQPAPAQAPAQQQYVSAPAATAAFPGQVLPAPAVGQPVQPQVPQPVAAAAGAVPAGGGGEYPPEAIAALQRMMANGQLPAFPAPQ